MSPLTRRLRQLGLHPIQSRTVTVLTAAFIFLFFWLALFNIYDVPSISYSFSSPSAPQPMSQLTADPSPAKFQKSTSFTDSANQYITYLKYEASLQMQASNLKESRFWKKFLKPMLVPRLPGTPQHREVRNFLIKTLKELGFEVELDSFNASTVVGMREFHNIIATRFPEASKRMMWAAHYDSKDLGPGKTFVGATDSAAPCALLLEMAARMQPIWDQWMSSKYGIQLVFFDGEEAFVSWSDTDSIYGARHLAELWEKQRKIQNIQVMILLDLLGAKPLSLKAFSGTTFKDAAFKPDDLFSNMTYLEGQLRKEKLIHVNNVGAIFNPNGKHMGSIADDHLPFQARGVPITHLIPEPFPKVWHQPDDNENALDPETLENLASIFTGLAFTQSIYA